MYLNQKSENTAAKNATPEINIPPIKEIPCKYFRSLPAPPFMNAFAAIEGTKFSIA